MNIWLAENPRTECDETANVNSLSIGRDHDWLLKRVGDVLYRRGLNGAGVDKIAKEVGTYKMSIYRAMGSKEKLCIAYVAMLDQQRADAWGTLRSRFSADPRTLLMNFFEQQRKFTLSEGFLGDPLMKISCELEAGFPELRSALSDARDADLARFNDIARLVRPNGDLDLASELYFLWRQLVFPGRNTSEVARDAKQVMRMVTNLLNVSKWSDSDALSSQG
jgi:AcrR family transcriptional regulator